ncbi:MAG: O-antigen ligase family protein [Chitinophagaceae bacterium]|nr:O-antigen ligase family protein [Chitinophagaceae bacterium]
MQQNEWFNKNLLGRIYVILSFIIVPLGESGLMGRITIPDIILVAAAVLLLGSKRIYAPRMKVPLFLVGSFLITAFLSLDVRLSLTEILVMVFLLIGIVVVYNVYHQNFKLLFLDISRAIILSLVVGVYDFFAGGVGLPRLFPGRAPGEIVSAFRNAGQAGAYVLVMLTILLPVYLSSFKNSFKGADKMLINTGIICGVVFLFISGKIAAYIGFFSSIIFLNIMQRNVKALFSTVFIGAILGVIYFNLEDISPALNKRIQAKIESRITDNIDGTRNVTEEGFIAENIGNAIRAFSDNPLSGSGIGAFSVEYGRHEVHSTYFKMVGETGLIGIIGYTFFFFFMFKIILWKIPPRSVLQERLLDYKRVLLPFYLGCLISWAYTYHLRKREFWIMVSLILLINTVLKYDTEEEEEEENNIDYAKQ